MEINTKKYDLELADFTATYRNMDKESRLINLIEDMKIKNFQHYETLLSDDELKSLQGLAELYTDKLESSEQVVVQKKYSYDIYEYYLLLCIGEKTKILPFIFKMQNAQYIPSFSALGEPISQIISSYHSYSLISTEFKKRKTDGFEMDIVVSDENPVKIKFNTIDGEQSNNDRQTKNLFHEIQSFYKKSDLLSKNSDLDNLVKLYSTKSRSQFKEFILKQKAEDRKIVIDRYAGRKSPARIIEANRDKKMYVVFYLQSYSNKNVEPFLSYDVLVKGKDDYQIVNFGWSGPADSLFNSDIFRKAIMKSIQSN